MGRDGEEGREEKGKSDREKESREGSEREGGERKLAIPILVCFWCRWLSYVVYMLFNKC